MTPIIIDIAWKAAEALKDPGLQAGRLADRRSDKFRTLPIFSLWQTHNKLLKIIQCYDKNDKKTSNHGYVTFPWDTKW